MQCPQCCASNPESARVCGECGSSLRQRCPACGADSPVGKKFCGDCGAPLTSSRAASSDFSISPFGAERRQLTVMFCDLVGSTELSTRLDPEDLRELIGAYHALVAEATGYHGGFVAKYMGDGILVYFGYPQAQEDDVDRAVRAGLEIVEAAGQLATSEPLHIRVGIATGLVVVGDIVGAGEAQERGIVGETPNLAARFQALAEPDSVVIGSTTRNLLGDLFEYKDLGMVPVKGFAAPVQAWQVLRSGAAESRFDALHASGLTPFIGREEEIGLLLLRWNQAKGGSGQVVMLAGEPGIGKSRVLAELRDRLQGELHFCIRYFCSPHHQDSVLYPFGRQIEHAAGFERDDTREAKLEKLATYCRSTGAESGDLPAFAELLSLPIGDTDPWQRLSPQQKKSRTFGAFEHQLAQLVEQAPVLIFFEDIHWMDPSSRELLDRIATRISSLPVLLVVTFRSELSPPWVESGNFTFAMLERFGTDKGAALVERVLAGRGTNLGGALVAGIVQRADGVPLFLEELTKAVLEAGHKEATAEAAGASSDMPAIPSTLQALLTARIDRLGTAAKEVGQLGAALGREFSYDLIHAIAPMSHETMDQQLDRLVASELIFRRGMPPNAVYTFKHALIQDAAYSTLLRADRQRLHARIARTLEDRFSERVLREPELLAHHFAEGHEIEHALGYMLKAGARAIERSANVEAIRHLTRGLAALNSLPASAARDRLELAFQTAIGTPLIAVKGYSASETGAAFSRARSLCERLGEVEPLVAAVSGEFAFHFVAGNFPMMQQLTDEAKGLSRRLSHPMLRLSSHRLAGITALHSGAFSVALSEFNAIVTSYDANQHRSQPIHYVHDPKVSALAYLAPVHWILGYPDQARRARLEAFECAAELNQANLTAHVHNFAGAGLDELLGDVAGVQAHADAMLELADRHSLHYWRLNGQILRGWTIVQGGAVEAGITLMRQSTFERSALGVSWYQSRYLLMLAEAYARSGDVDAALRVIAEAEDLVERSNEHLWTAELLRVAGELRYIQGEPATLIESFYERALSIAREQSAKSLELRAACSLARLWRDQARDEEARLLLASVYGWFSEGFDTMDLTRARLLLEDLKGSE
jgi:class 3 adenylate cyclase/predicted ATPase